MSSPSCSFATEPVAARNRQTIRLLAGQENLRVLMCDRQKLQGRFPRAAYSLFPAFYSIGAHIDDPGENCLAHFEGLPDGSDLGGC